MSVLRVLAVLSLIAVLTGCMIQDLKSDVRALRLYLALTPVPDQCKMPGQQDSSKTCLYKLTITDSSRSAHGIYRAKIHTDVYKKNAEDCPKVNQALLPDYASLAYDCPPLDGTVDFTKNNRYYPDTEAEYTFEVDGHPVMTVGDDAEFVSVPGTKHLKKN